MNTNKGGVKTHLSLPEKPYNRTKRIAVGVGSVAKLLTSLIMMKDMSVLAFREGDDHGR